MRKQTHGADALRASGHGSGPIGSVYEYLQPELTRRELAGLPEPNKTLLGLPTGGLSAVRFGQVNIGVPINVVDRCDYVVGGDPALANAAACKVFADYIVDTASALVEHLKTAPIRAEGIA